MGNSEPAVYNQQVPNSKQEGFSAIYRKKGIATLQDTPEKEIRSIRDMLKVVRDRYGDKEGIGEIIVTNEKGENGEDVEKRTVRPHTYREAYDTAYDLGRYIYSKNLYFTEDIHKMRLIGIYSRNKYEWFLSDWACVHFGITTVPLYDTLGVENLTYCLNQTEITSIFVADATVKVLVKLADLGKLKTVISYDPLDEQTQSLLKARNLHYLYFWDIVKIGSELKNVNNESIKVGMKNIYTFSYTSGTTGPPKGAMISHGNLLAMTNSFHRHEDLKINSKDRYLSYLPLPHLMDRSVTMVMFYVGAYVVVSSGNTLKLKEDCQAMKVTMFISVPRIFNRIVQGVKAKFAAQTGVKKCLIDSAVNSKMEKAKQSGGYSHLFYDSVVFSKVRQGFGGEVRMMATGSAPISAEVHAYMKAIMCCPFYQGYGQTQSSAAVLFSRELDTTYGDLTSICPGIELKLADIPQMKYTSKDLDEKGRPCPRGELWKRGPQVFQGYYKQPEVTKETITEDGWLKTGDVVEVHPQNKGFKIIDRKKNIFKLQQGEYLAPDRIESFYYKSNLITEMFLHGDSHQAFAVAVVVPDKNNLLTLAQAKGLKGTFEELCQSREVRKLVLQEINAVGRKEGLHGFELAKNIFLDTKGFLPRGILTNTMKLVRFEARRTFKEEIKSLYDQGDITAK